MGNYRTQAARIVAAVHRTDRYNRSLPYKGEPISATDVVESILTEADRGTVDALDEVLRVVDGVERGEPFGTEDMAMDPLAYVGEVARRARGR